jgi:hypothetical protein
MSRLTPYQEWVLEGVALKQEQKKLDKEHFAEQTNLYRRFKEWKNSRPEKS